VPAGPVDRKVRPSNCGIWVASLRLDNGASVVHDAAVRKKE